MPVDLSPAGRPSAYPRRMRFWPWACTWFVCNVLGPVIVLLAWPKGEPASGLKFWSWIVVAPNGLFLVLLGFARAGYEVLWYRAYWRNHHRDRWLAGKIRFAQRPLHVLGAGYCLPLGSKSLSEVLAEKRSILKAQAPRHGSGNRHHERWCGVAGAAALRAARAGGGRAAGPAEAARLPDARAYLRDWPCWRALRPAIPATVAIGASTMTAPWKKLQAEQENPFLKYFDGEMRYLREAGREFAQAHPDTARRVGMLYGEPEGPVRAVNEGFALLAARLRMKLDDGMPEVTDALLDNLYEHAARAIPSLSIIECMPMNRTVSTTAQIPAGAVVRSAPVGPGRVQCLYRTTQRVALLPLSIEDAVVAVRADGRTVIRLTFGLWLAEQREPADLSRIRLYLHGDRAPAAALYAALTHQVASIGLRLPSVRSGELQPLKVVRFEAAAFGPSTRLWPVTDAERDRQLDREQTLLEYFVFPQKFHFVDLCGFDASVLPVGEAQMTFEIELGGRIPGDHPVSRESFRLFCTPVINLFEVDAQPLRPADWHDKEHRVRVQPDVAGHVEPYDVLAVTAADQEDSARHAYQAFTSFRHRGWTLRYEEPERYFHTAIRFGERGRELWVGLEGQLWAGTYRNAGGDENRPDPDRYLTVRALANNGRLPRMALTEATITETVSGFTGIASVRNLSAPTLPLYPPRYFPGYDWRVLGHYTANGANELNRIVSEGAPVLREVLELYDWTADDGVTRRIDAIQDVRFVEQDVLDRGYMMRDIHMNVALDACAFDGPGDVVLFGDVLSYFVGRYACFHHSMRLVLNVDGKETRYPRTDFEGAPF
jgi:type VI secretion system protein ImpG